jgi:hypothetical protein
VKALSIRMPWASLIETGQKTIETRTWSTTHRGDILIVSSAKPPGLNAGRALCIARLVDCRPMTREDEGAACVPFAAGLFAWVLDDIRPIKQPFHVKGRQGLYEVAMPGRKQ